MEFFLTMGSGRTFQSLRDRLTEYNEHQSAASDIIYQADKLEILTRGSRYHGSYPGVLGLSDFKDHARDLKDPIISCLALDGRQ